MDKSMKVDRHNIGQLNELMPIMFPTLESNVYYDVLSEIKMVNMHAISQSYPDEYTMFDNTALTNLRIAISDRLSEMGYGGTFTRDVVADYFDALCRRRTRNPWREWLEGLKWDGKPRVRTWFKTVCGAKTPCLNAHEDEQYLGDVTLAWAIGSVARQYGLAQTDIIPLLIGEQRIGKSNCLRLMAHDDKWFADVSSDMSNPTHFLESVRGAVIIELSEATAIRSKDCERTKAFVSKRDDRYRRPYDREVTYSQRKWILCATSNLRTPFTDITGNMRYFPIYCNDSSDNYIKKFFDSPELAQYEVSQFWAEVMMQYHMGATTVLSRATMDIAREVQYYASKHNEAVDYLNDYLDNSERYSKEGAFITRREIEEIMINSGCYTISSNILSAHNNFIFQWLNSSGCDWVDDRKRFVSNSSIMRQRGFSRTHDAKISVFK